MSSDNIKAALVAAYPSTVESAWKRRSKIKVAGGTARAFEHADFGTVTTIEDATGAVSIEGAAAPVAATISMPKAAKAVAATEPKEQVISKRRQMVEKSRWRVTHDLDIYVWVENPVFAALYNVRDRSASTQAKMNQMIKDEQRVVRLPLAKIAAGTILTVIGKIAAGYSHYGQGKKQTNGLMVPVGPTDGVTLLGDYTAYHRHPLQRTDWDQSGGAIKLVHSGYDLPYNQIEAFVEPEEIPETLVYVLRDTVTGEYFGGWQTETVKCDWSNTETYTRQTNEPKMSKTFSGSKKYKNKSAVMASIRDFTGYNSGLESEGGMPEYAEGGDKKIDLPPTWEMVAIDKTTNAEKGVFDVQDWYAGLMRLRVLTKGHGSAVRAVYKKAEGQGFEAILLFQSRQKGSYQIRATGEMRHYDEPERFEDLTGEGKPALDAIKEAAGAISGKTIRVKTETSVAYACSALDGFAARMAFDFDDIDVKLLDINTLEELVEGQS